MSPFLRSLKASYLPLLALFLFIGLQSCGNEDSAVKQEAREKIEKSVGNRVPAATTATTTGTVFHYTCPNGHPEGGSNVQGETCPVCGAALTHNQAYHQQAAQQSAQQATANSSGVFHYTCPNGHPEGSNAQGGTCSVCGAAYVHNQAYHQQGAQTVQPQVQLQQPTTTTAPAATTTENNADVSGVFHYICPNGHTGQGSGSNIKGSVCAVCGNALVHNQAYHQ